MAARPAPPAFPQYDRVEGEPVDHRPTETKGGAPLFPEQTRAPFHATAPYVATVLVDGLPPSYAIAPLPDGRVLVSERLPGEFHLIDQQGHISPALGGLEALVTASAPEIGLLDVVLDPGYRRNHTIFFTYFEWTDADNAGEVIVARAKLDEDAQSLRDVRAIFRSIPAKPSRGIPSATSKVGARLAIGRDGYLYFSVGDRDINRPDVWDAAQRLDTDLGKIIRLTKDGRPAPGNPFAQTPGARPGTWSLGHRNQEAMAFDPSTGALWEVEHGPRGGDELNRVERGKNYGWPVISRGIDYGGQPITGGIAVRDGMEQPIYYWDPVIAPSGMAFYRQSLFPQWRNSLLIGGLRGMLLTRLEVRDGKVVAEEPLLTEFHSRIRDVRVGFDGAVYVVTDPGGGSIVRNTPPKGKLIRLTPR